MEVEAKETPLAEPRAGIHATTLFEGSELVAGDLNQDSVAEAESAPH